MLKFLLVTGQVTVLTVVNKALRLGTKTHSFILKWVYFQLCPPFKLGFFPLPKEILLDC